MTGATTANGSSSTGSSSNGSTSTAPTAKSFGRRLASKPSAIISGLWLILLLIAAAVPRLFTSTDPMAQDLLATLKGYRAPHHWLGTDELGRDVWSRLVNGTRWTLWGRAGSGGGRDRALFTGFLLCHFADWTVRVGRHCASGVRRRVCTVSLGSHKLVMERNLRRIEQSACGDGVSAWGAFDGRRLLGGRLGRSRS